jgi:hypothetical protein
MAGIMAKSETVAEADLMMIQNNTLQLKLLPLLNVANLGLEPYPC